MFLKKFIFTHSRLIQTLLPSFCLLCDDHSQNAEALCEPCQKELPILSNPALPNPLLSNPLLSKYCIKCAQTLSGSCSNTLVCGTCLKHPPPFDKIFALFPYEPPVTRFITLLKFQADFKYASFFAKWFIHKIQEEWYQHEPLPQLILPVPLHDQRLKERGFNQALEIGKWISNKFSIPIDLYGIKRIRETKAQSGLSSIARKDNIAGAFQAFRDYATLSIALLDDVVTTTSTITEISRILRQKGAKSIHVWCCARRG